MSYRTKYNPLRIKLNVKVAVDVERVGSEWITRGYKESGTLQMGESVTLVTRNIYDIV